MLNERTTHTHTWWWEDSDSLSMGKFIMSSLTTFFGLISMVALFSWTHVRKKQFLGTILGLEVKFTWMSIEIRQNCWMAKLNPAPLEAQKWEFFSATDKKNSEGQFSRKIQCNVLTFDKSKPPGGIYYVYIQRRRKSFVHSILKERGFGKQLPEPAKIRWEEELKSIGKILEIWS